MLTRSFCSGEAWDPFCNSGEERSAFILICILFVSSNRPYWCKTYNCDHVEKSNKSFKTLCFSVCVIQSSRLELKEVPSDGTWPKVLLLLVSKGPRGQSLLWIKKKLVGVVVSTGEAVLPSLQVCLCLLVLERNVVPKHNKEQWLQHFDLQPLRGIAEEALQCAVYQSILRLKSSSQALNLLKLSCPAGPINLLVITLP